MAKATATSPNPKRALGSGKASAGGLSKLFFCWTNPLVHYAYTHTLSSDVLWPMGRTHLSATLQEKFDLEWERQVASGSPSLFSAFFRVFAYRWIVGGIGQLFQWGLRLAFPLLIREILTWYEDDQAPLWWGFLLVGLLFVSQFITMAMIENHTIMNLYALGMDLRTLTNVIVFRKSMRLSTKARAATSQGKLVTLMSSDAEKLPFMTLFIHLLWVLPIVIIIAIYLLAQLIGVATIVGVGLIMLSIPLQSMLIKRQILIQKRFRKKTDQRVHMVGEVLDSMKIIKFYGWESTFRDRIEELRNAEIKVVKEYAYATALYVTLLFALPILIIFLTLIVYYEIEGELRPEIVFPALSLMYLIRTPILMLPRAMTTFTMGKVTVRRLEKFLLEEEMQWRMVEWTERDGCDTKGLGNVSLLDGSFQWPDRDLRVVVPKTEEKKNNSDNKKKKKTDTTDTKEPANAAQPQNPPAEAKSAPAGEADDQKQKEEKKKCKFSLQNITIAPQCGRLVAVVGQVGSGKSSLLQAILGEMPAVEPSASSRGGTGSGSMPTDTKYLSRRGSNLGDPASIAMREPSQGMLEGRSTAMLLDGPPTTTTTTTTTTTAAAATATKNHAGTGDGVGVRMNGSVAYCAQSAWIVNNTLRGNILFGKPMDMARYNDVIAACALEADIRQLPGGDFTEIGEKGINLSGGQKQRVALARAVYSDADVYLLDDVLSAVDAETGRHIFEHVICRLQQQGKKIIFVTNQLQFVRRCSHVVVLQDGRVKEQGTYQELMDNDEDFGKLMKKLSHHHDAKKEEQAVADEPTDDEKGAGAKAEEAKHDVGGETEAKKQPLGVSGGKKGEEEDGKQQKKAGTLVNEEEMGQGSVGWPVFRYLFVDSLSGWCAFIGLMILWAVSQAAQNLFEWWLSVWTTQFVDNTGGVEDFYTYVYAILGTATILLIFARTMATAKALADAAGSMHHSLVCSVLRAPMSFFDTTPTGRILNRFSKDMDQVDSQLQVLMPSFLAMAIGLLGMMITIIVLVPVFLIVVLPLMLACYAVQKYYRPVSRGLQRIENVSRSPIFSKFQESLKGVVTIRAFNKAADMVCENAGLVDLSNRPFYLMHACNRWLQLRLETLGSFIILAIGLIVVGGKESAFFGINAGLAGLLLTYSQQTTTMITYTLRLGVELEAKMTSVERIREYSTTLDSEKDPVNPEYRAPEDWPKKGDIAVKNLSMRYRRGLPLVLSSVDLHIHAGMKVGVAGRTGSGKSSLMTVLFRLVEPEPGSSITIDGVDCLRLGLEELRRGMVIIPQDPFMFQGSLRYNLDPFNEFSDATIWSVLKCAALADWISGLPGRLASEVEEGGKNFSLGQRQLICLARAILRKPKILIMDEATASIDVETDELVQRTVREQFRDCTVLTIAHRLETIIDSDRVLVMDHGRLGEYDTPDALLSNPESLFSSLVDQLGAETASKLRSQAAVLAKEGGGSE